MHPDLCSPLSPLKYLVPWDEKASENELIYMTERNTWNKYKCHYSLNIFHIVLHSLRFDWYSFNQVNLLALFFCNDLMASDWRDGATVTTPSKGSKGKEATKAKHNPLT